MNRSNSTFSHIGAQRPSVAGGSLEGTSATYATSPAVGTEPPLRTFDVYRDGHLVGRAVVAGNAALAIRETLLRIGGRVRKYSAVEVAP